MAEHQQLPWTWHAKSKDQAHNGSIYRMERPGHAYAIAMQPQYVTDEQFKADAAYIVKACNAFPDLVKALEKLSLAYVNLLEIGRDRIIALGGSCDPVDVMEAGDPSLRGARDVLGRVKGAPDHG